MDGTEENLPRRLLRSQFVPEDSIHFIGPAHRILFRIFEADQVQLDASKMGNPLRCGQVGLALLQPLLPLFSPGDVPVQSDDPNDFIALVDQWNLDRL